MKKVVLKVLVEDEKAKRKVLKAVSTISGIESVSFDMKDKKLTVVGNIDPVKVVEKLRKHYAAEILSVGPKEGKKDDPAKKAHEDLVKAYEAYYKHHPHPYYYGPTPTYYNVVPQDDYPNVCVIC